MKRILNENVNQKMMEKVNGISENSVILKEALQRRKMYIDEVTICDNIFNYLVNISPKTDMQFSIMVKELSNQIGIDVINDIQKNKTEYDNYKDTYDIFYRIYNYSCAFKDKNKIEIYEQMFRHYCSLIKEPDMIKNWPSEDVLDIKKK